MHFHLRKILDLPLLFHQWNSPITEKGSKECLYIGGLGNCFRILSIFQALLYLYTLIEPFVCWCHFREQSIVGSPFNMAPELLRGEAYDEKVREQHMQCPNLKQEKVCRERDHSFILLTLKICNLVPLDLLSTLCLGKLFWNILWIPPENCTNPGWKNAEKMVNQSFFSFILTGQADVFSYGIILCEIIGRVPADPDELPRTQVP